MSNMLTIFRTINYKLTHISVESFLNGCVNAQEFALKLFKDIVKC